MKINKAILLTALCAVFTSAHADSTQSVDYKLRWNANYSASYNVIAPQVASLTSLLTTFVANPTSGNYTPIVNAAYSLAATTGITNGHVVIALADGTVVVDTATGATPGRNTYANFANQEIELPLSGTATFGYDYNFNTRIAVMNAQLSPQGVGVETGANFDTAVGAAGSVTSITTENSVAVRLGPYLNSVGTVILSTH